MVVFVAFFQPSEDGDGACLVRFVDHHLLETAFKGFVFFKIFLILVKGSGTDTAKFASGKRRFQDVGGIHRAFAFTCTHESVDFVDKKDYFPVGTGHFVYNGLQSFLKFTFVLGSGDECAHVERVNLLCAQVFRDISSHDTLCKTLGNRSLACTRFTDKHGVIFGASAQNLKHASDFVITADNRVKLPFACTFIKIDGIF